MATSKTNSDEVITHRKDGFASEAAFREIDAALGKIRRRAFELFEGNGLQPGCDMDTWLQAERELFHVPATELKETGSEYRLRVAVPGFTPNQLEVAVEPQCVTIRGKCEKAEEKKDEAKTICSEFSSREIFRRFALEHAVNSDAVTASLDDGVLNVALSKAPAALLAKPEAKQQLQPDAQAA